MGIGYSSVLFAPIPCPLPLLAPHPLPPRPTEGRRGIGQVSAPPRATGAGAGGAGWLKSPVSWCPVSRAYGVVKASTIAWVS